MRISVRISADNCIRIQCSSEPVPRKAGDNLKQKYLDRQRLASRDVGLSLRLLRLLDTAGVDKLDLAGDDELETCYITREELIDEITLAVRTGYNLTNPSAATFELPCDATSKYVASRLDLLNESRRSKKVVRFGKDHRITKFSSKARRTLREAGSVLDRDFLGNTYLLTCTLPSTGLRQFRLLAQYSGYMIDRIQRLFRNIPDLQYYYVWEFQKRGALHLHYAISHSSPAIAYKACRIARTQFYKVLRELGSDNGLDMFASASAPNGTWRDKPRKWQYKIDKITKSVTGYLSKYLSKGSLGTSKNFFPARWWGCCSSLRRIIEASRFEFKMSELPNELARSSFYKFIDIFSALNPALTVPYEHSIYRDNIVDGQRIPTDIEFMKIIGCNLYFDPYKWAATHFELSELFSTDFFFSTVFDVNSEILSCA